MRASIAITGATSFTGAWIAREFALHPDLWSVSALCTAAPDSYSGIKAQRLWQIPKNANVVGSIDATDGTMLAWIRENKPQLWIHHHHFMERFRAPDYDTEQARRVGIAPLPGLFSALKESGCRAILFSGSYFEPGEGMQPIDYPSTPYSKSKGEVWAALIELCRKTQIALGKVVIPNPIGWLENSDRLLPQLLQHARAGTRLQLASPDTKGDQLPVGALARCYSQVALELLNHKQAEPIIARPSGWTGTLRDWIAFSNREWIQKRLGLPVVPVDEGSAPTTTFLNRPEESVQVDWDAFWDDYAVGVQKG